MMTAFSTLVQNFTRTFQITFESQLRRTPVWPNGRKITNTGDHKMCGRNSSRNYYTDTSLFQKPNRSNWPNRPGSPFGRGPPSRRFLPKRPIYIIGATGFLLIFYCTHLQESPITKRKRFIIFDNESVAKMSFKINQQMLNSYEPDMLSPGHPKHKKVTDVVNRLLGANEDVIYITKIPWKLTVVNKPQMVNAFVLVDGHIVVFTGMIDFCRNEDQLAAVLGHELSHVLLEHIAEKISNAQLLNMVIMIPILVIFTIFPLAKAILVESLMSNLAQLAISLPFSRRLEVEADEVGIILAARACFDVREASKLWERMAKNSKGQPPGFLSTHPSHDSRKKRLEKLSGPAMTLRSSSGCPPLD